MDKPFATWIFSGQWLSTNLRCGQGGLGVNLTAPKGPIHGRRKLCSPKGVEAQLKNTDHPR
jgi:hypothetical protein